MLLGSLCRGQHLFGVAIWFHVFKDLKDLATGADQESGPRDPHHLLAIHIFFFDHAVSIADSLVFIGKQGIRQFVFFLELLLFGGVISRYPQDRHPGFLQLCECVAEPARFYGSTRGIGFGVEEQHHRLSGVVF